MNAIFPNNPSIGQRFPATGQAIWEFNGDKWAKLPAVAGNYDPQNVITKYNTSDAYNLNDLVYEEQTASAELIIYRANKNTTFSSILPSNNTTDWEVIGNLQDIKRNTDQVAINTTALQNVILRFDANRVYGENEIVYTINNDSIEFWSANQALPSYAAQVLANPSSNPTDFLKTVSSPSTSTIFNNAIGVQDSTSFTSSGNIIINDKLFSYQSNVGNTLGGVLPLIIINDVPVGTDVFQAVNVPLWTSLDDAAEVVTNTANIATNTTNIATNTTNIATNTNNINTVQSEYLKSALISGPNLVLTDQDNNEVVFVDANTQNPVVVTVGDVKSGNVPTGSGTASNGDAFLIYTYLGLTYYVLINGTTGIQTLTLTQPI